MTFAEIENIAGVPIDHSFLTFKRKLLGCLSQPDSRRTWYDKGRLYHHYKSKKDIFNCIVERMKQQDSEQASDHDMPEDDKERMPEKYETVSLDDFVKYNIMKENIDFYGKSGFRQASEYGIRYHGLPEGYLVDEQEVEEFDRQLMMCFSVFK